MIVLNAAAQLMGLAAVIIIQTTYSIVVARLLGVEDFGRFSFVFSVTQIFLIGCDLGLHNSAIRKIAVCVSEREPAARELPDVSGKETASQVFADFFSVKIVVSVGLFICVCVLSAVIRESGGTRVALVLFAAGMFFQSLNMALNVTFQAHGKLYLASLNSVLMAALNLAI